MKQELLNERDRTSQQFDGIVIDWKDKYYATEFSCRCAMKAANKGYFVFGIQFYAECWSGPKAHLTYDKHGISDKCVDANYKEVQKKPSTCSILSGPASTNYVYRISNMKCDIAYTPIGCYADKLDVPRPVPHYTLNERDPSLPNFDGIRIKWANWNNYLPEFICRCAKKARELSHDIFSIQFHGECWSGKKKESKYARDGESNDCVGEDFKPCKCYDYHCAGKAKANYVYELYSKQAKRDAVMGTTRFQNGGQYHPSSRKYADSNYYRHLFNKIADSNYYRQRGYYQPSSQRFADTNYYRQRGHYHPFVNKVADSNFYRQRGDYQPFANRDADQSVKYYYRPSHKK